MTSETPSVDKAAETEGLKIRNWVLAGLVGVLFLIVQGVMTGIISSAATKVEATNEKLTKLTTAVEVEAVRSDALRSRVAELETAKTEATKTHRDIELRLNSLEQRAAVHDTWMTSHK